MAVKDPAEVDESFQESTPGAEDWEALAKSLVSFRLTEQVDRLNYEVKKLSHMVENDEEIKLKDVQNLTERHQQMGYILKELEEAFLPKE